MRNSNHVIRLQPIRIKDIRKNAFSIFIISLFLLYMPVKLSAGDAGSTAFNFLKIGVGPRANALGAYTAVSDDISAMYWNPAGLAQLNRYEASFMHFKWFGDISYNHIGFAKAVKQYGAYGVSLTNLSKNNIQGYDSGGAPTEELSFSDFALGLSYAYPLTFGNLKYTAGITTQYLQEKIADQKASALSFDLGVLTEPIPLFSLPIKYGISIKNLGTSVSFEQDEDPLPLTTTFGASSHMLNKTLLCAVDLSMPTDNDPFASFGIEYELVRFLSLRSGYRFILNSDNKDERSPLQYGLGIGNTDLQIDYAFISFGDLGDTHRFGVTVRFGSLYQIDHYQKRIDAHLDKAFRFYANKDLLLANREIELVLKLDPVHREARDLLDKINTHSNQINIERHCKYIDQLIRENNLLEAQEECAYILSLDPQNQHALLKSKEIENILRDEKDNRLRALFEQADEFYINGSYQDAIELLEKILVIRPQNAKALRKQAEASKKLEEIQLQNQRMYIDRQLAKAKDNIDNKKWADAVKNLSEIVSLDPTYPKVSKLLAECTQKLETEQKEKSEPYIQKGISLYRQEKIEAAQAAFMKALEICPEHQVGKQYLVKVEALLDALNRQKAQELNKQGLAAYSQGNLKKAISYFEKALAKYPKYEEAQKNLTRTKQELNQ